MSRCRETHEEHSKNVRRHEKRKRENQTIINKPTKDTSTHNRRRHGTRRRDFRDRKFSKSHAAYAVVTSGTEIFLNPTRRVAFAVVTSGTEIFRSPAQLTPSWSPDWKFSMSHAAYTVVTSGTEIFLSLARRVTFADVYHRTEIFLNPARRVAFADVYYRTEIFLCPAWRVVFADVQHRTEIFRTRKPLEVYLTDFDEIVICCRASQNKRHVFFLSANIHFKGVKITSKVHPQNHISLNILGSIEDFWMNQHGKNLSRKKQQNHMDLVSEDCNPYIL